jgi:peroxiredoxin
MMMDRTCLLPIALTSLLVLPARAEQAAGPAEVGKPAPDFTLNDLSGKPHKLSDLRGKRVVLEWFNPDCPFVKYAHTKGPLKDMAARYARQGVVWLAVNSGAPGKQGHGAKRNQDAAKEFALGHPILVDERGTVGRLYGAKATPHMYVIDEKGILRYRGAIDNAPLGEAKEGAPVNYVDAAFADLQGGRPVKIADTKAYGCSVKY